MIGPHFEKLEKEYTGVIFVKVDVDENQVRLLSSFLLSSSASSSSFIFFVVALFFSVLVVLFFFSLLLPSPLLLRLSDRHLLVGVLIPCSRFRFLSVIIFRYHGHSPILASPFSSFRGFLCFLFLGKTDHLPILFYVLYSSSPLNCHLISSHLILYLISTLTTSHPSASPRIPSSVSVSVSDALSLASSHPRPRPRPLPLPPQYPFLLVRLPPKQDVSQQCSIRAMPTFHAYKNGKKIGELTGAVPAKLVELLKTAAAAV